MDQPTTLEVRDFLPLGSRASAAIDKARDYVNAMRALGKVPGAITMYAADYDFVFNGVSRSHAAKYKEGGGQAAANFRTDLQRHAIVAGEG